MDVWMYVSRTYGYISQQQLMTHGVVVLNGFIATEVTNRAKVCGITRKKTLQLSWSQTFASAVSIEC